VLRPARFRPGVGANRGRVPNSTRALLWPGPSTGPVGLLGVANPEHVVRSFVARVNAHDVAGLVGWMSPRHRFTDSLGASWVGRAVVGRGWQGYFRWFPDYRIHVEAVLSHGTLVGLFGVASGSFHGRPGVGGMDAYRQPAAWVARVTRGKVATWSVFTDTRVPTRILERHGRLSSARARTVGRKHPPRRR